MTKNIEFFESFERVPRRNLTLSDGLIIIGQNFATVPIQGR